MSSKKKSPRSGADTRSSPPNEPVAATNNTPAPKPAPVQTPAQAPAPAPAHTPAQACAPSCAAKECSGNCVTFKVPYQASYGQDVYVVGSAPELGKWDPREAVKLSWKEGNVWEGNVNAKSGAFEYKYLVKAGPEVVRWESTGNRKVDAKGKVVLNDKWEVMAA